MCVLSRTVRVNSVLYALAALVARNTAPSFCPDGFLLWLNSTSSAKRGASKELEDTAVSCVEEDEPFLRACMHTYTLKCVCTSAARKFTRAGHGTGLFLVAKRGASFLLAPTPSSSAWVLSNMGDTISANLMGGIVPRACDVDRLFLEDNAPFI